MNIENVRETHRFPIGSHRMLIVCSSYAHRMLTVKRLSRTEECPVDI
ncbi:MAG: hypothetical protein IKS01_01190 [Paludibacteraceae bacterium]|nr:hypothetical protein [Paludibacteraceae bacterium]